MRSIRYKWSSTVVFEYYISSIPILRNDIVRKIAISCDERARRSGRCGGNFAEAGLVFDSVTVGDGPQAFGNFMRVSQTNE